MIQYLVEVILQVKRKDKIIREESTLFLIKDDEVIEIKE